MKKLIAKLLGQYLNLLAVLSPRKAGELGFYLFCTPQRTPMKDHHRQFLDSAERSSFLFDGYPIQVYRWGRGSKRILFLHGWQSHTFRWKNYIEAFDQEAYTLYAFDAPGHGYSGGKYLNLPIYSLVLETFLNLVGPVDALVSHSLGSFTALYTFHRTGNVPVSQLVITGTPGEVSDFFGYYRDTLGLSSRAEKIIRNTFKRILDQYPEYFSARKFARSLNISGLIIHDEGDIETPIHHAEAIHAIWKESVMVKTSGLGHNLRSSHIVKLVVEFLSAEPAKPHKLTVPEFALPSIN